MDPHEAQERAVQRVGTTAELTHWVIETSRGLRMMRVLKNRLLVTATLLAAPGILLLGLSFLTFNFPCREATYKSLGEMQSVQVCGVPALQAIRPLIGDVGFYGGSPGVQWTIQILTVAGPLLAVLLILRSQLSFRKGQTPHGASAEVAMSLDRVHMLALGGAMLVFLTVVAYRAAG
jgi:hypothetical protein